MNQRLSLAEAFQSTLPARGATTQAVMQASFLLISIHAPRTGSDPCTAIIATFSASFQSTLPARGATCSVSASFVRSSQFQSTLPARGATILVRQLPQLFPISIHAPRTGSDVFVLSQLRRLRIFQSTLPARGATCRKTRNALPAAFQSTLPARGATTRDGTMRVSKYISIHAPRTGSDRRWSL